MNVGIIGSGFVGRATHNIIVESNNVIIHDPAQGYDNIHKIIDFCDAAIICVPTPTIMGKQDISIMDGVLLQLRGFKNLIIIKSTTTPVNMRWLIKKYDWLDIMCAPEFLNQFEPYYAQQKHLIGVKNINQAKTYREIFNVEGYGHKDVRTTDPVTACMVKYCHNVFGALKVTFFNEMFDACEREGVNYREMLGALFASTDHIDKNYTTIAADGKRGFSGICFPKDSVAFNSDYNLQTVRSMIEKNKEYRTEEMMRVL